MQQNQVTVYYDGACPKCVRDRKNYEKLSGEARGDVCWFDITGQEERLRELGIDPQKALRELHVQDASGRTYSELDAYILLMQKVPVLNPLARAIGLPVIRPLLAHIYHWQVNRRLKKRNVLK